MPGFKFYRGNWKKSKWIRYDVTDIVLIPSMPGCYVIYLNDQLTYIGQSTNVRKRLENHGIRIGYGAAIFTPWGTATEVWFKVRFSSEYGDWAMRELRLIKRIQPPANCIGSIKKREMNAVS